MAMKSKYRVCNWSDYNKALVNRGCLTVWFNNATRSDPKDDAYRLRNHAVSQVGYHNLAYWKKKHNYHRRTFAETVMFRFKQLLGDKVYARGLASQSRELGIKCIILNRMASLGLPESYKK